MPFRNIFSSISHHTKVPKYTQMSKIVNHNSMKVLQFKSISNAKKNVNLKKNRIDFKGHPTHDCIPIFHRIKADVTVYVVIQSIKLTAVY